VGLRWRNLKEVDNVDGKSWKEIKYLPKKYFCRQKLVIYFLWCLDTSGPVRRSESISSEIRIMGFRGTIDFIEATETAPARSNIGC
jgi:hypothetical protein